MPGGQRLAVHRVGQQGAGLQGVCHREAPLEVDGMRPAVDRAAIRAAEHHLMSTRLDPGAPENRRQGHAGPFRRAHRPESPLLPHGRRPVHPAPVPGAFERDHHGLRGHLGQLVQAQTQRQVNQAPHAETPGGSVENRYREVVAPVELGGWRHLTAEHGHRALAVERLGSVDHHPGLDCHLALFLRVRHPVRPGQRREVPDRHDLPPVLANSADELNLSHLSE